LTFEGTGGIDIECRPDEDVVTAALRQGYILLTECRQGVCATCKGYLEEGDYDELLPHTPDALSPNDEEEGYVLACRLQPRSDLVIDFDYPAHRVERFEDGVRTGQIVALERLSETVSRVVIRTLSAQAQISYLPGQFVRLTLASIGVTRDFSMANLPNESRELEFLVRLLPDGAFSGYIAERARVGEQVKLEGPYGSFTLRASHRVPVFVAGGTGLAPIMAMLRQLAQEDPRREALLFFGNTNANDVFFVDEIDKLAQELPNLRVHLAVMHPAEDWKGEVGLVTDALGRHLVHPERGEFYLCGPPAMIDAARALLKAMGVHRQHIHQEHFIPSGR
jgi:methane monooxygenase component C